MTATSKLKTKSSIFYSTAGGLKRPSFINDLITLAFHHYIMYTVHMHLCTYTSIHPSIHPSIYLYTVYIRAVSRLEFVI